MEDLLKQYLSPNRRLQAYIRVILLEAKNILNKLPKINGEVDVQREEMKKISRYCLARVFWLLEKHPHDRYLIQQASKYAANLFEKAIMEVVKKNGNSENGMLLLG